VKTCVFIAPRNCPRLMEVEDSCVGSEFQMMLRCLAVSVESRFEGPV